MAQEDQQNGLTDDSRDQGSSGDISRSTDSGNLYGALLRTPLSEYPREAVTKAVNNITTAVGVCIVVFAVTSLVYPDRVTNAVGALASAVTILGTLYQLRKHGAANK